jgi:translation initiation factor IF-1
VTEVTKKAEQPGVIEEVLPRALYRVRLDGGKTVRASVALSAKHATVRFIAGSRVGVEVTTHDPNRGKIVRLL